MARLVSELDIQQFAMDGAVCLRRVFSPRWVEEVRRGIELNKADPSPFGEALKVTCLLPIYFIYFYLFIYFIYFYLLFIYLFLFLFILFYFIYFLFILFIFITYLLYLFLLPIYLFIYTDNTSPFYKALMGILSPLH